MNTQPLFPATAEQLADCDITAAIELLFVLKKGVTSQLIEVETHEGIVELTGFTNSLLSRERAEEIAKQVRGVRGVINELAIRTADLPDATLRGAVEQALAQDPVTADYNVRCRAHSGQVTVEGTVQSWAEAQLELQVLKSVRGVRQIDNRLNVRGDEVINSDAEITAQIRALLAWDIRIKSELITVRTDHGRVYLSGAVGSATEHDQVVATAYQAGASHVEAQELVVAYWALDPEVRREKFAPKADEDIAQAVRDVLALDPRVRAFEPVVHVRAGVATLAGRVSNLRARQCATQDAENVVGVREVHNLLQVESQYASPDAAIQQHVKAALACDAYLSAYAFTVNVSHGKVQLYGTVNSHADQQRAAEVAASVRGVVALDNHVQVYASAREPFAPAATAADHNIEPDHVLEQRIRNHYYWSALLHDQDIDIQVRHGRVTLTGTVDSRLDCRAAAHEALACGAREVNNHLHTAYDGSC